MKIIYKILIFLMLSSFVDNEKNNEQIEIIGDWVVVSSISKSDDIEISTICNVCPKINFNSENAILTYPNQSKEEYKWEIASDTLRLQTEIPTTSSNLPYFHNLKYKLELNKDEMRLSSSDKFIYVLRRTK